MHSQDFEDEQNLMGRLMHQLRCPEPDSQFALLKAAREKITLGGASRLKHTIPPIAFAALRVVRDYHEAGNPPQSVTEPVGAPGSFTSL